MRRAHRDFQIFAKPAGARCNLGCRYCYYLKTADLYPAPQPPRMADDLLEEYIRQHLATAPGPVVRFSWHGGEPTLLGLSYFRKIADLQNRLRGRNQRVENAIQTNGTLLDADWCRFFAREDFAVGLSLDGPQELHDRYRVTRGGEPTFEQVMRAVTLLTEHRVPSEILCVVNADNVRHPSEVYRFFKEIGASYITFLPLVEPDADAPGGVSPVTVPPAAFGQFLCTVFDEWVRTDAGTIGVQIFDEAARAAVGGEHAVCIFRETCGDVPVVEHNGDFYPCDHYVDPRHRLGNIREQSLLELLECPEQLAFGRAKLEELPDQCWDCEVLRMCNGGCPKDRILQTDDGEDGLNYLCEGYRSFFSATMPFFSTLASIKGTSEDLRRAVPGRAEKKPGRNDPCPCGSGRKYKHCCLGK
jgi:uncharacterized protein